MTCRSCGAEIAGNALICYRCGTATAPAKYGPAGTVPTGRRGAGLLPLAGLALLMLAGLYLGQAGGDILPAWAGWSLAGTALAALVWMRWRRTG